MHIVSRPIRCTAFCRSFVGRPNPSWCNFVCIRKGRLVWSHANDYHYNQLEIHSEMLCYGLWNGWLIDYDFYAFFGLSFSFFLIATNIQSTDKKRNNSKCVQIYQIHMNLTRFDHLHFGKTVVYLTQQEVCVRVKLCFGFVVRQMCAYLGISPFASSWNGILCDFVPPIVNIRISAANEPPILAQTNSSSP